MKLGVILVIAGGAFLIDGGMRFVLVGYPGLSGLIFALPCLYFGIKRITRVANKR